MFASVPGFQDTGLILRPMDILTTTEEMKTWSRRASAAGATIGFVPTMGYLHEGHLALMRRAREENDRVAVSIFVNPTQFGPQEDLDHYPRDEQGDTAKCREVGVEAIFMPHPGQMYAPGFQTYVSVEELSRPLCGASRPGHFRGVATVVLKLFNIVQPTRAYFGTKDYQQCRVIETMVTDLDLDVEIVPCPIVREPDGLAMSSRNAYLSPGERREALCLHEALRAAQDLFHRGEERGDLILAAMTKRIAREPSARIDYVSLIDPESLQPLERVGNRAVAALAVRIGRTRLIDNMEFVRTP